MSIKDLIGAGIITVVIGGSTYTVSQSDVIDNFATDTGSSQEAAREYVEGVKEEDLVPYDELGNSYVESGRETLAAAQSIDCVNYTYEWESPTLACNQGVTQLTKIGNNELSTGKAYLKLSQDNATRADIRSTITQLDNLNLSYRYEIAKYIMGDTHTETTNTNSYNKALLEAALQSE